MDTATYNAYVEILKEELIPAMGCTEPIAVAYAAAIAADRLGTLPEKIIVKVSPNILKNVKSVVVPNTGGLRGVEAAAAAGIIAGDWQKQLEVISVVTDEQRVLIAAYLEQADFVLLKSESGFLFDIEVIAIGNGHTSVARIAGAHTNVIYIAKDDVTEVEIPFSEESSGNVTDRSVLNIAEICQFADCVKIDDVKETLDRQIEYNMAISNAGMEGKYGACIGKVLMASYGDTVQNRAKAFAAAGSDARMNGCNMPVIINSGSGNQGITASVPVIVYARDMGVSEERLYRALVVSNLVTIHLKTGIGPLSAYCGAISAGCGAGAGVTYLRGGKFREIAHTIVNALAINSGVICDGAKSSCAAKIASAVEAGLLGMQMFEYGTQFYGGEGIVTKGVENTIRNVGRLARQGMAGTDKEIIDIMISC